MVKQYDDQLDQVFHALADPTRREIIRLIASQDRTVTEIAAPFKMSLAAISKHIKVLENAGLLQRKINGRTHMCRLDPQALSQAAKWLIITNSNITGE